MDLYNMTNIFPILLVILDNFQWKIWIANGPPGKGTGGHTDGQTDPVSRTGHALVRGQIGGKERSIMEHIYWKERKMSNKHRRSVWYGRDTHPGSNLSGSLTVVIEASLLGLVPSSRLLLPPLHLLSLPYLPYPFFSHSTLSPDEEQRIVRKFAFLHFSYVVPIVSNTFIRL